MDFTYNNGKIWQWDQGVLLDVDLTGAVPAPDGKYYAHFCKVGTKDIEAVEIVNRKAPVPNDLLQEPGGLIVYGFYADDDEGRTLVSRQFQVLARPMPPEYIYEPTPVITYPELVQLVEDLEALRSALHIDADPETGLVEISGTKVGTKTATFAISPEGALLRVIDEDEEEGGDLPTVLGGIDDPVDDYDAANKKYIDGLVGNVAALLADLHNGGE